MGWRMAKRTRTIEMKLGEETTTQIIVMDWIRFKGLDPITMHIANERKSSIQAGALLKRMGVKSGVSDLFIARASREYHGLWLELKSEKGKVSANQSKFMADMVREGYATKVAYSADEAIFIISDYLMMSST
jgi:hypothetical protein